MERTGKLEYSYYFVDDENLNKMEVLSKVLFPTFTDRIQVVKNSLKETAENMEKKKRK